MKNTGWILGFVIGLISFSCTENEIKNEITDKQFTLDSIIILKEN